MIVIIIVWVAKIRLGSETLKMSDAVAPAQPDFILAPMTGSMTYTLRGEFEVQEQAGTNAYCRQVAALLSSTLRPGGNWFCICDRQGQGGLNQE